MNDTTYFDIPLPPGARLLEEPPGWGQGAPGAYSRSLLWARYGHVDIDGTQHSDGSVTRQISLWAGDGQRLTSAQARQLAAALLAAADECDAMS